MLADGTGRTVAVDVDAATTPYERWHLYLLDLDIAPPRMLHEVAAILGRCQEGQTRRRAADRQAADELGAVLVRAGGESTGVAAALRACGLPDAEGPYRVITADTGDPREGLALGALAEVVAHVELPAAVGCLPDGTAFAVLPGDFPSLSGEVWRLVAGCEPSVPLRGGIGATAAGPQELAGALAEARYALASARSTAPDASLLTDVTTLSSVDQLLTGIPTEVRTAYRRTVLGPLLETGSVSSAVLLGELGGERAFAAADVECGPAAAGGRLRARAGSAPCTRARG